MACRYLAAVGTLLCFTAARAQTYAFNYSNTHGDHMVLQRGQITSSGEGALLWGFGTAFAAVQVNLTSLDGASTLIPGLVDSTGVWRVRLPAQPAGGPFSISGSCPATGESFQLTDVLFGDVILCGGQSNMALGMSEVNNATALIAAAGSRPDIRILSPQYSAQNLSQSQFVLEYSINWTSAAEGAPNGIVGAFSAVCYLTAAGIYDSMNGSVPLGLIDIAVGGTMISLWLSPDAVTGPCLDLLPFVPGPPWTLSCWHNGMFAPLAAGPTDVALLLWDQGENDVGWRPWYECAFPLLISTWRAALGVGDSAPFLFVQLPEYLRANDTQVAELRQAQLSALALANTAVAVTADNGDPLSKDTSIHTLDKSTVAARLTMAALALKYGEPVPYVAPFYVSASPGAAQPGDAPTTLRVNVRVNASAGGLVVVAPTTVGQHANSSLCPHQFGVEDASCAWFEVQDSAGVWSNATWSISADGSGLQLVVNASVAGATANATRNGYGDWPVVSVYNSVGLPLTPWTPQPVQG